MKAFRALAALAALSVLPAAPQDIEPRAYSNAPIGVNFAIAGYAYTRNGLSFDPSLPVTDEQLHTSNAVFAYARAIELWGKSAKVDVVVPYTWLSGSAIYAGAPVERIVDGIGDPAFRLSVNLYGAPPLALPEFAAYRQDVLVGVSLRVSAPWGQYDPDRLINLSTNRWILKPEAGVSKAAGPWVLEVTAGVNFYTVNTEFYGGKRREQDPLYSLQGHAIYSFRSGSWASFDGTYFAGGRTKVNGVLSNDLLRNWRVGATYSVPVDRRNSIKFYASSGISARTGNNFDLVGIAWQHRWGGGL
jgi:hypothetical protein